MNKQQERAAFEAWGRAEGLEDKVSDRGMNYPLGDHLWMTWLARAALAAAPQVPEAELDALRKDAERYRWLRDNGTSEWGICVWGDDDQEWAQDMRAADVVDREIDAAMELHNAKLTGEAGGDTK